MEGDFITIVITQPDFTSDEAAKINLLLSSGAADYVHLRKPDASYRDMKRLIEDIDIRFRERLKIHGHFALLEEFNLGGIHLNKRCPEPSSLAKSVSKSMHSLDEMQDAHKYSYVTLSPIYPSISKPGYAPSSNSISESDIFPFQNVIALGGVVPERFEDLKRKGFMGAALLGYVWQHESFDETMKTITAAKAALKNR